MLTNFLLKPFREWLVSAQEEMRIVRQETAALRKDIAQMHADVQEMMGLLRHLLDEMKRIKEQLPVEIEDDDTPTWHM